MQCTEYSKIWLHLTFVALSLSFTKGHKAFPVFHTDRVFIGLPCGQGQLSRIWKVQCYWLSMGKECCSRLRRRLRGGTKYQLALKRLRGRPLVTQSFWHSQMQKALTEYCANGLRFKADDCILLLSQKGRSVELTETWLSHRNNETLLFAEVSTFVIVRNKVEEQQDHGY